MYKVFLALKPTAATLPATDFLIMFLEKTHVTRKNSF